MMRPWRKPGVGVTRSGAKELEDDPEVEAEPVRSLDGAQVRRGGGTLAAQRLCVAEQDVARRRLGFAGAVVYGRWGAGEGQGAFKKGWPGISACAPAVSAAGIAGSSVAVAREEDGAAIGPGLSAGGGEPGKRGPWVSECGRRASGPSGWQRVR